MNSNLECININWATLGAKLANLSDVEQRKFFKSFASEMNKYESIHQRDMQLCYMSTKSDSEVGLSIKESEVFSLIGEFSRDDLK